MAQNKEMPIDEKKIQAKSNERSVATERLYSGIVLGSRPIGKEPRPSDRVVENHNHSITRCYSHHYARCSAGSDNQCDAGPSSGRPNPRPSNVGRASCDGEAGGRPAASSPVYQDQGVVQSAQPVRERVPVPCPCSAESSRKNSVDSSRLHTSSRSAPSAARNRRGAYDVQPPPCGDQNARRCDYDVEPEPRNFSSRNDRRATYDVSQPCAALRNDRRNTYDVSQPRAAPRNGRRNTYDASQPGAAPRNDRRSTGCGSGARDMTFPFTMTGTIQLSGFEGLSPVRRPPRNGQSSSCNELHETDGDVDDFLDNHLDYDMVAPRGVAVPGRPYVPIDESGANATPDEFRVAINERVSLGSQAMGVPSPPQSGFGSCRPRDTLADHRDYRPFGHNDSFAVGAPRDRQSRARSAAPARSSSSRDHRRRDTFDRCTR